MLTACAFAIAFSQQKNLVILPGSSFVGSGTISVQDSIINSGVGGITAISGRMNLVGAGQSLGTAASGGLRFDTLSIRGTGTKRSHVGLTVNDSLTIFAGTILDISGDSLRLNGAAGQFGALISDAATVVEYGRGDGHAQTLLPGIIQGKTKLTGSSRKVIDAALTMDSLTHTGGGLIVNASLTINGASVIDTLLDVAPAGILHLGSGASTFGRIENHRGTLTGGAGATRIDGSAVIAGTIAAGTGGVTFTSPVVVNGGGVIQSTASTDSLAFLSTVDLTAPTSSILLAGTGVASFAVTPAVIAPSNLTLSALSTVYYVGGVQMILPGSYGTLVAVNAGTKTLPSGTVQVARTIETRNGATIDARSNGSTVEYNGIGAQTIAALSYANLTLSGNKNGETLTLDADTIRVSGVFAQTATNAVIANAANTFEYDGIGPQTVTPFGYANLILSGAGDKALLLSQTTAGNVLLKAGTNLTVDAGAAWQIGGLLQLDGGFVNNGTIDIGN